ncbi:hypothetical protein JIG36_09355 [Actinoplanes sp. LDG1-06]|uniref:Secreted protein n=1 Tax=Paractinoplanes ovalisporus TaxID=2810368 RepID=A0ABS2A7F1_9ACTN|nr:hypothetical protein [Actinoplanes ovalisporus]MBM2615760.1 hypothetical protein [Actinoplanes ovalisporus]
MTRRGWSVVVLTVVALVVYLITPDRLPSDDSRPSPVGTVAVQAAPESAEGAYDPSQPPRLTSDGVTTLSRADLPAPAPETVFVSSSAAAVSLDVSSSPGPESRADRANPWVLRC